MPTKENAEYRCAKCNHEWKWPLGSHINRAHQGCPQCGSLLYMWTNYLKLFPVPVEVKEVDKT